MIRKNALLAALAGSLLLVVAVSAWADSASLAVAFVGFSEDAGHRLEARLIDARTGLELARSAIPSLPTSEFLLEFAGVPARVPLVVELFVDRNDSGAYDAPPTDYAMRAEIAALSDLMSATVSRRDESVDIRWPSPSPVVDGAVTAEEYPNSLLHSETGMTVSWWNDTRVLVVALESPGTGWLSIGFDPVDAMLGANYVLAAVSGDRLVIEDHFGTSRFAHSKDAQDDVLVAAGREQGGRTTVEFAIPLDSGDAADKPLLAGSSYVIQLAFHASSDSLAMRHTSRGEMSLLLD